MSESYPWDGQPRHWRDRAIAWGARRIVQPMLRRPASWKSHRRGFRIAAELRFASKPRGLSRRNIMLGDIRALEISPKAPKRRLLWVHGGGFVVGSPETHFIMLAHLAHAAEAVVIAPRYRLAPEDPHPRPATDVEAAARAGFRWRENVGPFILGGDSAGGCLALVALADMLARDESPAACVFFSPATIIDPDRPVPEADDLLFPEEILHRIGADYAAGSPAEDPRLSPVKAAFPGAPPTLIQCVNGEYLEEDSDVMAAHLRGFGTEVSVEKVRRMPHVWQFMAGSSPLADDAIRRAAAFIGTHT
ncbi:MAG: alpha/beta hydrolase fold domain-containing protein [Pseudomonadota bacterium]